MRDLYRKAERAREARITQTSSEFSDILEYVVGGQACNASDAAGSVQTTVVGRDHARILSLGGINTVGRITRHAYLIHHHDCRVAVLSGRQRVCSTCAGTLPFGGYPISTIITKVDELKSPCIFERNYRYLVDAPLPNNTSALRGHVGAFLTRAKHLPKMICF